ncbi:hypothetical protein ACRAWD_18485 [Caulobacter segnis]
MGLRVVRTKTDANGFGTINLIDQSQRRFALARRRDQDHLCRRPGLHHDRRHRIHRRAAQL